MEKASAQTAAPVPLRTPPLPLRAGPPFARRFTLNRRYAGPFTRVYLSIFYPVFGGITTAVACRVILSLFELLCFVAGVLFFVWAFRRRSKGESVFTWRQAREVALRTTFSLGLVPFSACASFLIVNAIFGLFWGYAAAVTLAVISYACAEADDTLSPSTPPTVIERGNASGGIDEKLREEYEKARRQHTRRG